MQAAPSIGGAGLVRVRQVDACRPSLRMPFQLLLPALTILLLVPGRCALEPLDEHIPVYELSISCDHCSLGIPPRLKPGEVLDLTLRPRVRVFVPVVVHAALQYDSGIEPWPLRLSRSSSGTFRLRAFIEALPGLRPGLRQLLFCVGPAHALPPATRFCMSDGVHRIQVLQQPIEIEP